MRKALLALAALLPLASCSKGPTPDKLDTDQKIVHSVLSLLASDGKPVCVSRLTFGSPLSQYRVARRGQLERYYVLDWFPPTPWRPPAMPTQKQLRDDAAAGRNAHIPEPPARTDELPRDKRSILDGLAFAISPPAVELHSVHMRENWMPKGVIPRWWPGRDDTLGCDANYVLSGVKRSDHVAFVAVRVHHWGTLYALVTHGDDWRVVGQWGPWLY